MSTIFQPTRLVGAIAIAMGFSSTTFAQDQSTNKTATLDTIVVTASKIPESVKNVPARISVIDEKNLSQSPIKTLPQILTQEASLNVKQTGGYGQTASVSIKRSCAVL